LEGLLLESHQLQHLLHTEGLLQVVEILFHNRLIEDHHPGHLLDHHQVVEILLHNPIEEHYLDLLL